jgi:hypothetical protein
LVVKVEAAEFGTSKINYATDEFVLGVKFAVNIIKSGLVG